MKHGILMRIQGVLLIALALGCSSGEEKEAKRLGFSDVEEMRQLQAEGWHTKQRYEEEQERLERAKLAEGQKTLERVEREMQNGPDVRTAEEETKLYEAEAKYLGFASVEEMKELHSQGYYSKADYLAGRKSMRREEPEKPPQAEEPEKQIQAIKPKRPYPYLAYVSCGLGDGNINVLACFQTDISTGIELRNGERYGLYQGYKVAELGYETSEGLKIQLAEHFDLEAQNASDTLILGVKIYDMSKQDGGRVVFEKQVGAFGTIRVGN